MNILEMAQSLYDFTGGYPFLVSNICKIIDERLDKTWTGNGLQQALKIILEEKNTFFDDMSKNLESYSSLYDFTYAVLIVGETKPFTFDDPVVDFGAMFGYFKNTDGKVSIANKIFDIRMTNYFVAKDAHKRRPVGNVLAHDLIQNGRFNMELCLQKFAEHYGELYAEKDISFLERHGRMVFLSYLKPLINGQGFYHIESQLTDLRRMDIVVDFGPDQFIIELKVWHGEKYKEKAYEQLIDYMTSKNADTGYLLTFDFRKNRNKISAAKWVQKHGKHIFDVTV